MDLLKLLVVIFLVLLVGLVMLKVADTIGVYYERKALPLVNETGVSVAEAINNTGFNASDYDVYHKTLPYFSLLDVTLVIAFLAGIAGAFIYTRERT